MIPYFRITIYFCSSPVISLKIVFRSLRREKVTVLESSMEIIFTISSGWECGPQQSNQHETCHFRLQFNFNFFKKFTSCRLNWNDLTTNFWWRMVRKNLAETSSRHAMALSAIRIASRWPSGKFYQRHLVLPKASKKINRPLLALVKGVLLYQFIRNFWGELEFMWICHYSVPQV